MPSKPNTGDNCFGRFQSQSNKSFLVDEKNPNFSNIILNCSSIAVHIINEKKSYCLIGYILKQMTRNLVVVESPAKSKTVSRFLNARRKRGQESDSAGTDHYEILATGGHIRESTRVDIERGFELSYKLIPSKKANVQKIKDAMKNADQLFLATDPDREGEAISAHIRDELKKSGDLNGKPIYRVVFYEVTSAAVRKAVENPGKISETLVDAQKSRDALDMLVGFSLSPLLIRKLSTSHLSAGRVQSPALRLIVERQREINEFKPQEFWTIHAELTKDQIKFEAVLTHSSGSKLEKFSITNEKSANEIVAGIESELVRADGARKIRVQTIRQRKRSRRPRPPYTTSTLVQDASSKLRMTARRTASVAQKLYEGLPINGVQTGLITYSRTDSTTLSATAISQIRKFVEGSYGQQNLPNKARIYVTKSKNVQEAHEAIRPTDIFRTPSSVRSSLDKVQYELYRLIWNRAAASQMKDAVYDDVTVELATANHTFRATGSTLRFPGWLSIYQSKVSPSKDAANENRRLPALEPEELVAVADLRSSQHFTQPPPRYNNGSLIKQLEEYGIGRPSTWPTIITKLIDRKYVLLERQQLIAKSLGCVVVDYLNEHFGKYVDYKFTSHLENGLDEVARGEKNRIELLSEFWQEFDAALQVKKSAPRYEKALGLDPDTGREIIARVRGGGAFIQIGRMNDDHDKPLFRALPQGLDLGMLTLEKVLEILKQNDFPRALGELNGKRVQVLTGRYGPYVSVIDADGTKTNVSLRNGQDPLAVTLEDVSAMLAEKSNVRIVGQTDAGHNISIRSGRFGPYISVENPKAKLNVTLSKYDDPQNITFERAMELIKEKKQNPYKRRKIVIKNFEDSELEVLDGRYGPYVTNGKVNVTVPKNLNPSDLDLKTCQQMIAEKIKKGSRSRKPRAARRRKSTTKRKTR